MKRHQILLLNCLLLAGLVRAADAVPPLLNYQGRLTDEAGQPLASGGYRLAFRLWAEATSTASGNLVWGREFEVTVVGGAFNVILSDTGQPAEAGLNAELPGAFAAPSRFLGLTILRTPSGIVPAAQRKEIMPRQQLLSAPFAFASARAATAEAISTNATVQTLNLAAGVVTLPKLASRQIRTNLADVGDIAFSQPSDGTRLALSSSEVAITNLSVTLVTTGRPVLVFLSSVEPTAPLDGPDSGVSYLGVLNEAFNASVTLNVYRDTTLVSRNQLSWGVGSPGFGPPFVIGVPPSCVQLIDSPPQGTNRYSITASGVSLGVSIANVRLVAFEL